MRKIVGEEERVCDRGRVRKKGEEGEGGRESV